MRKYDRKRAKQYFKNEVNEIKEDISTGESVLDKVSSIIFQHCQENKEFNHDIIAQVNNTSAEEDLLNAIYSDINTFL